MTDQKSPIISFQYTGGSDPDPVVLLIEYQDNGITGIALNRLDDAEAFAAVSTWNEMYQCEAVSFNEFESELSQLYPKYFDAVIAATRRYLYDKMHNVILGNKIPLTV